VIDSKHHSNPCPEHIAVIGGGRWARTIVRSLDEIVRPSVRISVHSPHNAEAMAVWVADRKSAREICVSAELPLLSKQKSSAVIVVNAARDHEMAIEWALAAGVPVLVEKPIALSAAAAERLVALSRSQATYFAAANIFLFASYLDNFAALVAKEKKLKSVRVHWKDPRSECRYGEEKQYDAGLPVFADWLPHVLSIAGALMPDLSQSCESLKFFGGGAHLELELRFDDIPCKVILVRNGDKRQRVFEVRSDNNLLRLAFSVEPGTISSGTSTMVGDPDWESKSFPSKYMLKAFLQGAAGAAHDPRLNIDIGLRACRVIDQASDMYRSAMMPWLIDRLLSSDSIDQDLRYAFREIIQTRRPIPSSAVDSQIRRARQNFSIKAGDASWLDNFVVSKDPSTILELMMDHTGVRC
jgi:predicted dehydrogenase